jgi:hypothetical protein
VRPVRRPWFLRPRGRAALVVVVLGLPRLLVYASVRILPGALWFDELGQLDVFRRIAAAKAELWLLVAGTAAPLVALTPSSHSRAGVARTRSVTLAVVAASLLVATSIASSAAGHWQTFLLWRHRQPSPCWIRCPAEAARPAVGPLRPQPGRRTPRPA